MGSIAFGPVPSRRLGISLGINNIPPKTCSYSCVYCQLGITTDLRISRSEFYEPSSIVEEVKKRLKFFKGKKIDYITFVPDGEPTLDINLDKEIEEIKKLGIKVAIITNSSLIWREDVRKTLKKFDLVSVKIDAVDEKIWKKLNRPHPELDIEDILQGIAKFSREFKGVLLTETMLISKFNDNKKCIEKIARFIKSVNPTKSYISIPTRPPAERSIIGADEKTVNFAYHVFSSNELKAELLTGFEGYDFSLGRNIEESILDISSVHPLREDILLKMLEQQGKSWEIIEKLIMDKKLKEVEYCGRRFYIRRFTNR